MEFWLAFWKLLRWLTSPSIIPWAGAVAAVLAACVVCLKTPLRSVWRALFVGALWLIFAWMLSSAAQLGSAKNGGKAEGSGSADGTVNGPQATTPSVAIVPGQFPPGTPEHVDLVISFVASQGNPAEALEFSCDLFRKDSNSKPEEIRAKDMEQFNQSLVEALSAVNLDQQQPTILIKRSPFPGENVLQQVRDKVRAIIPNATVMFDE